MREGCGPAEFDDGGNGWPYAPKSGVPGGTPPGTAETGTKAADEFDDTGWKMQSIRSLSQLVHLPLVVCVYPLQRICQRIKPVNKHFLSLKNDPFALSKSKIPFAFDSTGKLSRFSASAQTVVVMQAVAVEGPFRSHTVLGDSGSSRAGKHSPVPAEVVAEGHSTDQNNLSGPRTASARRTSSVPRTVSARRSDDGHHTVSSRHMASGRQTGEGPAEGTAQDNAHLLGRDSHWELAVLAAKSSGLGDISDPAHILLLLLLDPDSAGPADTEGPGAGTPWEATPRRPGQFEAAVFALRLRGEVGNAGLRNCPVANPPCPFDNRLPW